MPFNPFSTLTSKIFATSTGLLLLAFGAMVLIHRHDASRISDLTRELGATDAKLAVSNASIAELQASLSAYVGAGKAAKVAQLASIEAAAKGNAELQRQADAIRAEMAAMKPDGKCATPDAIRSAKGL